MEKSTLKTSETKPAEARNQAYAEMAVLGAIKTVEQFDRLQASAPTWILHGEIYQRMEQYVARHQDIPPRDVIKHWDPEWECVEGDFDHWLAEYQQARSIFMARDAIREALETLEEEPAASIGRLVEKLQTIGPPEGSSLVWAEEVEEQDIRHLVRERVYAGKLHLLGGLEGTGKSTLVLAMAAPLTRGEPPPWEPLAAEQAEPKHVLFISYEDGAGDTLKRRARLAGADMANVAFWSDAELPPAIPDDVAQLERYILTHKIDWVIIDPIDSALAERVDSHKSHSVRRALHALGRMAERTGAAVTFIMHPTKGDSADPFKRISGSRAFTAAARSCDYFGRDPDDPALLVLVQFKNNLGPPQTSLTFTLQRVGLEGVRMVHTGYSDLGAEDLLASGGNRRVSKLDVAKQTILLALGGGEKAVADLRQSAEKLKISWKTFENAKAALKKDDGIEIESFQKWEEEAEKNLWYWKLPEHGDGSGDADAKASSEADPGPYPEEDGDPGPNVSKGKVLGPGSYVPLVSLDLREESGEDPEPNDYGLGPPPCPVEDGETQAVITTQALNAERGENACEYAENDPGPKIESLRGDYGLGPSARVPNGHAPDTDPRDDLTPEQQRERREWLAAPFSNPKPASMEPREE